MKYFLLIVVFFIGFSFALPGVVVGQSAGAGTPQYTADNPPPPITLGAPTRDPGTGEYVNFIQTIFNVYKYAQLVAVALAAIMITLGGINIAVSGAIDRQAEGKDMIKSAIFGLVLLFGANLILRTINPALTDLTPPHVKTSVMPVRECEEKDFAFGPDGKPQRIISTDCAVACDNSFYKQFTDAQKKEYTCVEFCGAGVSTSSSNQCVQKLEKCDAGEQPEQFPPECYAEQVVCNPTAVQACSERIVVYGHTPSEEAGHKACKDAFEAAKAAVPISEYTVHIQEKPGYKEYLACEKVVQGSAPSLPPIPDCNTLYGGQGCLNEIKTDSAYGKIQPGAHYIQASMYPKNKTPADAQCLMLFYEKIPTKDGEKPEWEEPSRRGLKKCPVDPFGSDASGGSGAAGGGGGSGVVRSPSLSEPPREGCANCTKIDQTRVALKPAGNAGAANSGCWLYSNKDITFCQLNGTLLNKLYQLARSFPGLRITEAWPPTAGHKNNCQFNGTCADVTLTTGSWCTDEEVARFMGEATGLGLRVANEYPTCGGVNYSHARGGGHFSVSL